MKHPLQGLVILLVGGAALATLALGSAPVDVAAGILPAPTPQQARNTSACASYKPPKGVGKFTGRIEASPSGTSFEVNSGSENAVVAYTGSTEICQGGQATTAEALIPGKTVTVYGESNRVGKTYHVAAAMIVVEGNAASAPRMTSNPNRTNSNSPSGAPTDPNPTQNNTNSVSPPQNNSDSTGRSQIVTGTNLQQNARNSGGSGITCESMTFNVAGAGAIGPGMGRPGGRMQVDGITCVMPVNQESIQLIDDAITGKRMASANLTWQNAINVTLTNAFVSSVQFTSEGSQPVARVTFLFTKMDLQGPGGTRITLEGKP